MTNNNNIYLLTYLLNINLIIIHNARRNNIHIGNTKVEFRDGL